MKYQDNVNYLHKGENCHSKNIDLDNENIQPNLQAKIKEELEKSHREQQKLLKENKQNIIDFIIDNKDSIKVDDLRIYEPIYKCYSQKGNCHICNSLSNIICISCSHNYKNKGVWLCAYHWKQHGIDNH